MRSRIEERGSRKRSPLAGEGTGERAVPRSSRGFTLVEMIMVIVITGIIGGIVAVFLRAPIQQYTDVARRADMTDIADTALRRITRDLRLALPNSVRVTGACDGTGSCNLEFIPTHGGGRYCAAAPCDELDFSNAADGSFDVLGPPVVATASDFLVIYNLGIPSVGGCAALGADAYEGCNRRAIVTGGGTIAFAPTALPFPFDSPGRRFHVATSPVSYICTPNPANPALGTLARLSGYGWAAPSGAGNLLAKNVSSCRFAYDAHVVAQRSGLVTMHLGITEQGETVTLYSAAHVSNQP